MITWQQFFESRENGETLQVEKKKKENPALEKKEELLHKDLDGDGEKGESKAHKEKVLKKEDCKPCKKSPKKSHKK